MTFKKSPAKDGVFEDWMKYLWLLRNEVHVIVKDDELLGMIVASNQGGNLYVKEMITLDGDCFKEFVARAFEIFGPFETLTYIRRGKPKTISYKRLKELAL